MRATKEVQKGRMPVNDMDPFHITFEGLDADDGVLDMALLAKSLDGYARIIATASSFASSGVHLRHMDAMPLRVRVTSIQPGSFEITAVLEVLHQAQLIPDMDKWVKAVIKYVLDRITAKKEPEKADMQNELVTHLMEQSSLDRDLQRRTLEKLVDQLVPAARNAVAPVGETCASAKLSLGQEAITVWDESDKRVINEKVRPAIQPSQRYRIYISELDIETGSAKFSFSPGEDHRYSARITDPALSEPNNAYAEALSSQEPLEVTAKAEIMDGQITRMHISDADSPPET